MSASWITQFLFELILDISSARRRSRKAHFGAASSVRRNLMAASLSKDLRGKHNVGILQVTLDD
jgi:large subunit ribosomal protein L26e